MSLTHVEDRPIPADCRADSRLQVWEAAGKRFFVLTQKGRFADLCYDHGRLLAKEIEDGVFPEILATIAHSVDASDDLEVDFRDKMFGAFFNRLSDDVLTSSSQEFQDGVAAVAEGCLAELSNPLFDTAAVEHACVAIDTGNIAAGFDHLMTHSKFAKRTGHWLKYAAFAGANWGRSYDEFDEDEEKVEDVAINIRDNMLRTRRRRRARMGCTGFWAAPALTTNGLGVHARNFDGAFFAWNNYPVFHLIDETPTNSAWQRYAAVGTAGLIYPGGISGVNEAGIAASLHQMSTVNFTAGDRSGDFDVAPYVQQRILREAKTLDDAVDIARSRNHFASWTIMVSHAPSGEALRIELNGARDDDTGDHINRVEAGPAADRVIQTNHFLSTALAEQHKLLDDAHFTTTVGKWMETRARFKTAASALTRAASSDAIDTGWAHDLQADHADDAIDGHERSFGRTICKAYSLMSSIARTSADRANATDEMWFTVGERLPGPHSTLVGFTIDWQALSAAPAGTHDATTVSPEMLAAMEAYVEAFAAYDRPRRADGDYIRRRPTPREMQAIRQQAIAALDRAVDTAEGAGINDPVFRYIRARLCHEAGIAIPTNIRVDLLTRASDDWAHLRSLADNDTFAMTEWERALIYILSAATESVLGSQAQASPEKLLKTGRNLLDSVAHSLFSSGREHRDIKEWRKVIDAIETGIDTGSGAGDVPDIDFVTVE